MSGYVYFIRPVGKDGPVKIGYSIFVPDRLLAIQVWHYIDLEIAAELQAPPELERKLHNFFALSQIRGEWFDETPTLLRLIDGIKNGKDINEIIDLTQTSSNVQRVRNISPQSKKIQHIRRRIWSVFCRLNKLTGSEEMMSDEVREIMKNSGGYRERYKDLTEAETQVVEDFIAQKEAEYENLVLKNKKRKRSA